MRKISFIFSLILLSSCSSVNEENNELINKTVIIEFLTTEPNFDEIMVSYYQSETETYSLEPYTFKYDSDDNPLPLKITLANYSSRVIDGEAFRGNYSLATLSVKIYVDNELVLEDSNKGTSQTFATVNFKYTIPN